MICFKRVFLLLSLVVASESRAESSSILPEQKLGIAFTIPSITRSIKEKLSEDADFTVSNIAYSVDLGLGVNYELFLSQKLSITALIEMGLGGQETSLILIGGAGGVSYYFMGGKSSQKKDKTSSLLSYSTLNFSVFGGIASYQYDFAPLELGNEASDQITVVSQQRSVVNSNTLGLEFGGAFDYSINKDFNTGIRFVLFNGFSSAEKPTISFSSIWISSSFNL